MKKYLTVYFAILTLCMYAEAAQDTLIASGNWRTDAAWKDGTAPTSADTAWIVAQNYVLTIPAGETDSIHLHTSGTTPGYAVINDSGTIVLMDTLYLKTYTQFNIFPGGALNLNGKHVCEDATGSSYVRLYFTGASGSSRAKIYSSPYGGRFLSTGGGYSYADILFKYADFDSLGISTFAMATKTSSPSQHDSVYNCTWNNCGDMRICNEVGAASNLVFRNNDVRNYRTGGNGYMFQSNVGTAAYTGKRDVINCTFSNTFSATALGDCRLTGRGWIVDSCIFRRTVLSQMSSKGHKISNCVFYNDSLPATGSVGQISDSTWFYKNYVYASKDNPHPIANWTESGVCAEIWKNVFEMKIHKLSDAADIIMPGSGSPNLNIHHNIVIDSNSGAFLSMGNGTRARAYNVWNNTTITRGQALTWNENGAITLTGTDSLWNNLVINYDPINVLSRGINMATAGDNQISYSDYNNWVGVNDLYYQVTFDPAKTEGADEGFGKYDKTIYPYFTDTTRNIAKWNMIYGSGINKDTSAIIYLLGINGYNETNHDQSNTPSANKNLWKWVSDGYHPTNDAMINLQRHVGDSLTNSFGSDSVVSIIFNRGRVDSTATTYADSFELSSYVDSATVYLEDSTSGGTWGTRATSAMLAAGAKGRMSRTETTSGKYWIYLIAITNQGAVDTAKDSIEYASSGFYDTLWSIAGTGGTVSPALVFDTCTETFRDTATAAEHYQFSAWSSRNNRVTFADTTSRFLAATFVDQSQSRSDTAEASFDCIAPTLTYASSIICTTGIAAITQTPTLAEADSVKAISSLPGGLAVNITTGALSGTPTGTVSIAKAGYQIRAYGCSNTDAYDSITVVDTAHWCVLTATAGTGGTITEPADGHDSALCNSGHAIEAAYTQGHRFVCWTRSSTAVTITDSTDASTTATGSGAVVANFVKLQYILTVAGNGTNTPSTGLVDSGAVTAINNIPMSGWFFKSWAVTANGVLGSATTVNPNTVLLKGAGTVTATDTFPLPQISYTSPNVCYTRKGYTFTMTNTGGAASSVSAASLPVGLTINEATGTISGITTTAAVKAGFAIVATNVTGTNTFYDTFTVNSSPNIDSIKNRIALRGKGFKVWGTDFGDSATGSSFYINSLSCPLTMWKPDSIRATVPIDAPAGLYNNPATRSAVSGSAWDTSGHFRVSVPFIGR